MVRRLIYLLICVIFAASCSDRKKDNPFDPEGVQPLNLNIIGLETHISLTWNHPNIEGFSSFNLYRSTTSAKDSFDIMENIPSNQLSYRDFNIILGQRYYYYITIVGQGIESKPSQVVTTIPGAGFNWIIDGAGDEVLKFSYDLQYPLLRLLTNSRPSDMAVSKLSGRGLILFTYDKIIRAINLQNGDLLSTIEDILHPYAIVFDEPSSNFWVVDSSGPLYKINDSDLVPRLVSADEFSKPISITLAPKSGFLYICDVVQNCVFQVDRSGTIKNMISDINGIPLDNPVKYIHDEIYDRDWLLESKGSMTYIYTKYSNDIEYTSMVLSAGVRDMEIALKNESAYVVEFNGINSSVVQLYPDGSRQIAVTGFYNPIDIEVNKYDASLLVADTGNGIIWHFNHEFLLIGSYSNLYLPSKVILE